jgi:hypothetical protein
MSIVLVGSTSGSVTLQEPAVAGTTVLTLPAVTGTLITTGTTGQVIASGALPIGSVLQVVNATYSTAASSSSSTYADTGLTATITPKFSTSKILVLVNHNGCRKDTNNTILQLALFRSSTQISGIEGAGGNTNSTAVNGFGGTGITYLDSPATTSATTYKTQFKSQANNATVYINDNSTGGSPQSTITLMEIAA